MDFFDVSKDDCENHYANEIDNWQLVDTSSIDCGDDPMKDKCLCGSGMIGGAIISKGGKFSWKHKFWQKYFQVFEFHFP
jgi:hypothetical protein